MNEWETPIEIFEDLDKRFGPFTLDPCATHENAKCKKYYTIEDNGLLQNWEGETVFMNPPYGTEVIKWMKKAYQESKKENTQVVCLIAARTDTNWWHRYCMRAALILFVKQRITFIEASGTRFDNRPPFPSAIIVFNGKNNHPQVETYVQPHRRKHTLNKFIVPPIRRNEE